MHIANLAFILNYDDGTTKDEIESDLFRVLMQPKGTVHYDRDMGGSFENLEQEKDDPLNIFLMMSNLLQSVYQLNEERNNNPYIVVGPNNIKTSSERNQRVDVSVEYSLLQDHTTAGQINSGDLQ